MPQKVFIAVLDNTCPDLWLFHLLSVILQASITKTEEMQKKFDRDYCPASPVLEWMGNKWAMVVLLRLEEQGTMRFNELFRTIPRVSEKMLASALRHLVDNGLATRTVYAEVPPRTDYALTPLGRDFLDRLHALIEWSKENVAENGGHP